MSIQEQAHLDADDDPFSVVHIAVEIVCLDAHVS